MSAILVACLSTTVTATSLLLPLPASSQTADPSDLPRLGDAAGQDLSPATERRIGEAIMRDLRRDRAMIDDAEINQYLNDFTASLTSTAPARGFTFEFFALRDATLNAFALPGGYIGVHSGLIVTAQTESELASVLAHEVGHVTQRHVARMLAQNRQGSVLSLAAVFLAMLAASSNPQAAAGLVALGGSVYEQQMLSFSRDAEREADRIGLEILREAGFHASDMVAFFGRMQQATRIYDNGAPGYLRTHPLTTDRMADIQNRVLQLRYRQRADSTEFHLVQAKLRGLADASVQGLREAGRLFKARLNDRTFRHEAATWYGLAVVAAKQGDRVGARKALAGARKALATGSKASGSKVKDVSHPYFERLHASVDLSDGKSEQALTRLNKAIGRYPNALALRHLKARVLLASKSYDQAIAFIDEELGVFANDLAYWQLLSKAHAANGDEGLSHWAQGERYRLLGGWQSALEQYKIAQRDKSVDFYRLSQIDARINEMQDQLRLELENAR